MFDVSFIVAKLRYTYYMQEPATNIETQVGEVLKKQKATIAVAESCTAGLVMHRLTNVSGSSAYLMGGIVAYDNRIKEEILIVSSELLQKYGAVSPEVASEMAVRVKELLKTTYGLSITGIAGPTGGTPEKPVGLVYIAVAGPIGGKEQVKVVKHIWPHDREGNKIASSTAALELLYSAVTE
jgi:nicotinamide-nucleotide amidase